MSIHILPSIFAFVFTCIALVYTSKKDIKSKTFYVMMLIFALHHCSEVMLFIEHIKETQTVLLMKVYYILSIWTLIIISFYALEVSEIKSTLLNNALITASFLISLVTLFSNLIISDSLTMSYSNTAIKGPLYFLFQISAVSLLASIVYILISGYKRATSHLLQIRCAYILLAFSPLILSCLIVIVLMSMGLEINATVIMPITISIFLFIVIKGESKHKLTDLRRYMPFSSERKTSQEIMELYSSYAQDEISYRDCMAKIERLMVIHKYNKSGNNASATAKSMGMPRSSLYSIFNRLKIDVKDQ